MSRLDELLAADAEAPDAATADEGLLALRARAKLSMAPSDEPLPAIKAYAGREGIPLAAAPAGFGRPMSDPAAGPAAAAREEPIRISTSSSRATSGTPVGDLQRLQRKTEALAGNEMYSQRDIKETGDLYKQQEERAKAHGEEVGKVAARIEGLAASQEHLVQQRDDAMRDARSRMENARKLAQYPTLSLQEIDQQQRISEDSSGRYTPEQKRAAQLSLKRASEIDPNRLLNKSTGTKIMAIIAQAMGAFVSAKSGGRIPNYGGQAVESAIERDIMAQKMAFDKAGQDYDRERSMYADLRSQFDTENQTIAAQKAILLEQVAVMAEKYKAEGLGAELHLRAKEHEGKMVHENVTMKLNALAKSIDAAQAQNAAETNKERTDIMAGKEDAKDSGWPPPGTEVMPGEETTIDKTERRTVKKGLAQYKRVEYLLDQVIGNRGEIGAEVLNRVKIANAEAYWARLFAQIRQIDKTGVHLSPAEAENISKQIGKSPTSVQFLLPRLYALRESLRAEAESEMSVYGIRFKDSPTESPEMSKPTAGVK